MIKTTEMMRKNGHTEAGDRRISDILERTDVYQYGMIETSKIPFYREIREICEGNACRSYGTTWACPPATGTFEECRYRCMEFEKAVVFNGKFALQDSLDVEGMQRGHRRFKELCDQVYQALKTDYPDHLLLSNEGCIRCENCTWPDAPCRMPDRLFPSIEGFGIQVAELAQEAGVDYYEGNRSVLYFGMFLYARRQ